MPARSNHTKLARSTGTKKAGKKQGFLALVAWTALRHCIDETWSQTAALPHLLHHHGKPRQKIRPPYAICPASMTAMIYQHPSNQLQTCLSRNSHVRLVNSTLRRAHIRSSSRINKIQTPTSWKSQAYTQSRAINMATMRAVGRSIFSHVV